MTHDEWRLLGYGLLTAFLMALVLVPILLNDKNFSKLGAEGILGVLASRLPAIQVHGTACQIKMTHLPDNQE